jgi:hypothetical protein
MWLDHEHWSGKAYSEGWRDLAGERLAVREPCLANGSDASERRASILRGSSRAWRPRRRILPHQKPSLRSGSTLPQTAFRQT